LVLATVLAGLWLSLGVFLVKIVYNGHVTAALLVEREKAFWLAKGGLVWARYQLAHQPNWYTDLPHWPEGEREWLIVFSKGAVGELGEGSYKVVREMGKPRYYAVGLKGKAIVILEGAIK